MHSSSETKNDLQYHLDLLKEDNIVLDRYNLGEFVYPQIYGRAPKMNWKEQLEVMNECEKLDVIYVIFYASDFNTLKERLYKRGDTQQVLDNAEKLNILYKALATQLSDVYDNVYMLDITKVANQMEFFEEILKEKGLN